MKRLNRKEEAVSPVIATILMVAITVVLAATLYMMVADIGGNGDLTEAMGSDTSERDDGWLVSITSGSRSWETDRIILFDTDDGVAIEPDDTDTTVTDPSGANLTFEGVGEGNHDLTIRWNDNDDSGSINSGDTLRIRFEEEADHGDFDGYELRIRGTTLEVELG